MQEEDCSFEEFVDNQMKFIPLERCLEGCVEVYMNDKEGKFPTDPIVETFKSMFDKNAFEKLYKDEGWEGVLDIMGHCVAKGAAFGAYYALVHSQKYVDAYIQRSIQHAFKQDN